MSTRIWFIVFVCCAAINLFQANALADDHEFRYKAPDAKTVELMGNGMAGNQCR